VRSVPHDQALVGGGPVHVISSNAALLGSPDLRDALFGITFASSSRFRNLSSRNALVSLWCVVCGEITHTKTHTGFCRPSFVMHIVSSLVLYALGMRTYSRLERSQ
jgi:hypothetical protein